jgi:hypothetical protein
MPIAHRIRRYRSANFTDRLIPIAYSYAP